MADVVHGAACNNSKHVNHVVSLHGRDSDPGLHISHRQLHHGVANPAVATA